MKCGVPNQLLLYYSNDSYIKIRIYRVIQTSTVNMETDKGGMRRSRDYKMPREYQSPNSDTAGVHATRSTSNGNSDEGSLRGTEYGARRSVG